jgi:hypothetical protein
MDTYGLSVTNPASPVGGSDPESVESMRYTISRGGTRIRDRAVTLTDYADLAMQVPGVSKSVAYGTVYTAVNILVAPPNGQGNEAYMERLCNSVEAYLDDKIMIGSSVNAGPLDVNDLWQDVYIQIMVHVQDAYNRTTVRLQCDSVVRSMLTFTSVDFGYRVSVGAIYRAVLAVQGVSYAELEWLATSAPVDDTDPEQGDTYEVLAAQWQHESQTDTTVAPNARHYRRSDPVTPTSFAFSLTDNDGVTRSFAQVRVGDHLVYRPALDVASWMSFVVTALPVVTTFARITVLKIDAATPITAPGNNDKVTFSIIRYTPTPDSLNQVTDIATDELLIPRIAPLPAIISADVSNVALTTNVATLTYFANLTNPIVYAVGQTIDVAGVTPTLFNGRYVITAIGTNTVSYDKTNANVASASSTGTVKTVNLPESETDYPDMSEAERTHDGLWVKAVGGLPNT